MLARGHVVPVVAALAAALAGCSGGGEREPPAPTPDAAREAAIVRRSQIAMEDFPAGWGVTDDAEDSECAGVSVPRAAASAHGTSGTFHPGTLHRDVNPSAQSAVYLYPDAARAHDALAMLSGSITGVCLGDELAALVAASIRESGGDVIVAVPSSSTFTVGDPFGDERQGRRVKVYLSASSDDVEIVADLVVLRTGRGVAMLVLADVGTAFDEELREELTFRTGQRLDKMLE